jgi:putative transcriptional regulator
MSSEKGPGRIEKDIIEGLTQFRDALKSGERIEKRFTVRTVELDLQPMEFDSESVREVRMRLGVSQAVFAKILGVKASTVESWEQGRNTIPQMACRLLEEIQRDPQYWIKRLEGAVKKKV